MVGEDVAPNVNTPRLPREHVLVIASLAAKPRPENPFTYGGLASGATYIESDPIRLYGGSYSTYADVEGDPVSESDPLGLCSPTK